MRQNDVKRAESKLLFEKLGGRGKAVHRNGLVYRAWEWLSIEGRKEGRRQWKVMNSIRG